jgi:hypothetical protein
VLFSGEIKIGSGKVYEEGQKSIINIGGEEDSPEKDE